MERVLVVDDEPEVCELCRRTLEPEGYQVNSASSGRQAIELAQEEPFDLLLVDIRMPGLNGLETYQAIKEFTPDLIGVVITGYGSMETAIEALRLGFSGFVTKPFDVDDLLAVVAEALEKKRLERENARLRALMPLFELGRAFMTTLDLDDLLKQVVQTAKRETEADTVSLMLLDEERQKLSVKASLGLPQPKIEEIAGWVVERGEPLLTDEKPAEPQLKGVMERGGMSSALAVPLMVKGKLIGVLNLSKPKEERPFTEGDLELVSVLGGQAAVAIENARLHEVSQRELDERKRAEEELRESENRYRIVSETASDYFYSMSVSPDGAMTIDWIGGAFERITGYTEKDVRDLAQWVFAINPDDLPTIEQATQAILANQPSMFEYRIRTRAGEERWLHDRSHPVWDDEQQRVVSIIGAVRDITELKEVDRLKSSMVANVSHEFRAPLASIKAYTELLLDELDEGDRALRHEFLSVIDRETDRLTALINDFLDLSRLEARRFETEREALHLGEVVEEAITSLERQIREKEIAFQVNVPADLSLFADEKLMVTLVKNLVSNAVKFSHQGGRVEVKGWEDESEVFLSVEDEGIGIPEEELPHIFEKFHRIRSTTESGIEGTGLGLVLAKAAAEAHGGTIEVESEWGVGSRFTVRLPKSEEGVHERRSEASDHRG